MKSLRRSLLCVMSMLVAWTPSPGWAADEVGLSADGQHWTHHLTEPLFDPAIRWVPGDVRSTTFYVRNQGPSGAVLSIAARGNAGSDPTRAEDIAVHARVANGQWIDLPAGAGTVDLSEQSIRRGDAVPVEVRVSFDPASTNQTQTRELGLSFDVTLTDDLAGGTGSAGFLPGTGTTVSLLSVAFALVLLILGFLLVTRRREADESDV